MPQASCPQAELTWPAGNLQLTPNRSPKNGGCIGRRSTHISRFAGSCTVSRVGLDLRYTSKQAASHFMTRAVIFLGIGAPAPILRRPSALITPNKNCARRRRNAHL